MDGDTPGARHYIPIGFGSVGVVIAVASVVLVAWLGFFVLPPALDAALSPVVAGLNESSELAGSAAALTGNVAAEIQAGRTEAQGRLAGAIDELRSITSRVLGAAALIDQIPLASGLLPDELVAELEAFDARLGEISTALTDPNAEAGRVVAVLEDGAAELDATSADLAGWSATLDDIRTAVLRWNVVVTIVVIALIGWIAAGQISLVRSGLHQRREHPDAAQPG